MSRQTELLCSKLCSRLLCDDAPSAVFPRSGYIPRFFPLVPMCRCWRWANGSYVGVVKLRSEQLAFACAHSCERGECPKCTYDLFLDRYVSRLSSPTILNNDEVPAPFDQSCREHWSLAAHAQQFTSAWRWEFLVEVIYNQRRVMPPMLSVRSIIQETRIYPGRHHTSGSDS